MLSRGERPALLPPPERRRSRRARRRAERAGGGRHRSQQRSRRVVRCVDARRRRRHARLVTSANVACGFHAGDPSTLRRVCAVGGRARRRDRRPGVVSRPRRLRATVHRHRPRRAARRGALPARCARRLRAGRRCRRGVREAARRAVPRHDRRPGAGAGRRRRRRASTTRRRPSSGCPVRSCCGPPRRRGSRPIPEAFADRAYLSDGRWCRGASPTACSPTRPWWRRGRCAWRPSTRSSPSTGRSSRCVPGRSASTATHPARCSSPRPCGPGSRSRASPSIPFDVMNGR